MAKLIASVYANSLFDVAKEKDDQDLIKDQLELITNSLKDNKEFYNFFISPKVSKSERKDVIKNVFKDKISKELLNFLMILIDKKRTSSIYEINKFYKRLYDENIGLKRVTVESVIELSDNQKSKLSKKLEKMLNKEVIIENKINPEILGGVILRVDNEEIDNSIATKLKNIEESIAKIIV
mgnify:FL=1